MDPDDVRYREVSLYYLPENQDRQKIPPMISISKKLKSIYEGLRRPRWSQFASEIYNVDTMVYGTYNVGTYLNRIEFISGTKFTIITIFYNVYSKYNIPRKGQGKSTRDYRGLTNLRFSFARHQQSLLITHFPVSC